MFKKLTAVLTKLFHFKKAADNDDFTMLWQDIFTHKAAVFCGLFGGMYKLSNGNMKHKRTVLTEWCARVTNRLDDQAVNSMKKMIMPLIEEDDPDMTKSIAGKLMDAARAADIGHEEQSEIIIEEKNFNDYTNLYEDDFSLGDKVGVLVPAWYQNGRLLEKGIAQPIAS